MARTGQVLTINAGSSSLKVAVFDGGEQVYGASVSTPDARAALDDMLAKAPLTGDLAGIGHRIVHGGPKNDRPRLVDAALLTELRGLVDLDPDHLPAAIAIVEAMQARFPGLRQVACFDTAFHSTMPRAARLFAIPNGYEGRGVIRYGFHGLSYTFLLGELGRVAGAAAAHGRVILAHLGAGASLAAVRGGRCVDTTMGFTPTGGIPMATRSGDLDPGVILHLLRSEGVSVASLDELLNKRSGLLGLSGTTGDMRTLLAHEATDPRAADAVAVFCHQTRKAVGAMAASIGGCDTLVFSGGIGEHSSVVRARVCEGLEHLGVHLDPTNNAAGAPLISSGGAAVRVIPTDEESVVSRETLAVLEGRPS